MNFDEVFRFISFFHRIEFATVVLLILGLMVVALIGFYWILNRHWNHKPLTDVHSMTCGCVRNCSRCPLVVLHKED